MICDIEGHYMMVRDAILTVLLEYFNEDLQRVYEVLCSSKERATL